MNGFGVTDEELELARQCATRAAVKYGDDAGAQLESIRAGHIWNDHVAVQAAVEAIKAMKPAACQHVFDDDRCVKCGAVA